MTDDNVTRLGVASDGRFLYGYETTWKALGMEPHEQCNDCGVATGREHLPNCDQGQCSICEQQDIGGCDCER